MQEDAQVTAETAAHALAQLQAAQAGLEAEAAAAARRARAAAEAEVKAQVGCGHPCVGPGVLPYVLANQDQAGAVQFRYLKCWFFLGFSLCSLEPEKMPRTW
jgi:hypothetical protein